MRRKETPNIETLNLIRELKDCAVGRTAAVAYEKICCRILRHLFPREFFTFKEQCPTHDGLYRMDVQVSLNGKTKFWRILINNFQSRYVVFEFKNYENALNAPVIDLTKKYFCRNGMRNVIFMISRKGFDSHARTAAMRTIQDSQLMIELTDADLIAMLRMKLAGQDPSVHLMNIVDQMLMGFSA